ncbi:MAG: polysaccharide export protein [Rhodobacteraceae bacterium]|nr:polysaccharide biosynthesis/export family protein [Alphaproteobacteria bacterium]NNK66989.1 polysaccharide export protein [Paracoccaceae bacterium]
MTKRLFLLVIAIFWATFATAQDGYRVQPGDRLAVEVLEDSSLSRQVLVLPDGSISFPLVGNLRARGQTTDQIEQSISAGLAPNFAAPPTIFVSVAALAPTDPLGRTPTADTIDVYFMGEIENRGRAAIEPGTTLLQALAQAGGFSKFAATKRIQLRRTDPQTGTDVVFLFNYRAVENGGTISGRTILADGDVIVVPQRRLFE